MILVLIPELSLVRIVVEQIGLVDFVTVLFEGLQPWNELMKLLLEDQKFVPNFF